MLLNFKDIIMLFVDYFDKLNRTTNYFTSSTITS